MPKQKTESRRTQNIVVENLQLQAGSRTLLNDVNVEFHDDRITLIVGPSGAGKSLLLKIIAGLMGRHDGEVSFTGKVTVGGKPAKPGQAGVVFQQFALFDELSSKANVEFARSHRESKNGKGSAKELLSELHVPTNVRTSQLSGGQRQRLALARALAYQPSVLLYDEPTSGLDLGTARKVAEMIRETQEQHKTNSVIVTHDYESLLSIADEVFFLNPENEALELIPKEDWKKLPDMLDEIANKHGTYHVAGEDIPEEDFNITKATSNFFAATSRSFEEVLRLPLSIIPNWRSTPWGMRYFLHYCGLVFGPTAWVYVLIAGLIIGYVTTYFIFKFPALL